MQSPASEIDWAAAEVKASPTPEGRQAAIDMLTLMKEHNIPVFHICCSQFGRFIFDLLTNECGVSQLPVDEQSGPDGIYNQFGSNWEVSSSTTQHGRIFSFETEREELIEAIKAAIAPGPE